MTPRKLIAESILIGLPVVVSRSIGLLMLPIYTRAFSPADLGFIETLVVLLAFFQIFSTLETGQALARFLPETKDKDRQGELIGATLSIFLAGAVTVLGVASIFAPFIFDLIGIPTQYATLLPYVACYLVSAQIFYFFQIQFIYRFEAKKSAIINFSSTFLIATSCLALFMASALTVKSFLVAQSVGYLAGVIIAFSLIHAQGIKLTIPSKNKYFSLLKYSCPLLVSSISVILASSFDKVLISKLISLDELGYYSVASRLAASASIAFQVFGNVITPYLFNPDSEASAKRTLGHIFGITSACTLVLTILLMLFSDSIAKTIATESYAGSAQYLVPAFLIAITGNLYRFFPDLDIFKRTKTISLINLLACALGCGVAFSTISQLGASGIILGRFVGAFSMSMMYWYLSSALVNNTNNQSTLLAMALFPISYILWWVST